MKNTFVFPQKNIISAYKEDGTGIKPVPFLQKDSFCVNN